MGFSASEFFVETQKTYLVAVQRWYFDDDGPTGFIFVLLNS